MQYSFKRTPNTVRPCGVVDKVSACQPSDCGFDPRSAPETFFNHGLMCDEHLVIHDECLVISDK